MDHRQDADRFALRIVALRELVTQGVDPAAQLGQVDLRNRTPSRRVLIEESTRLQDLHADGLHDRCGVCVLGAMRTCP